MWQSWGQWPARAGPPCVQDPVGHLLAAGLGSAWRTRALLACGDKGQLALLGVGGSKDPRLGGAAQHRHSPRESGCGPVAPACVVSDKAQGGGQASRHPGRALPPSQVAWCCPQPPEPQCPGDGPL